MARIEAALGLGGPLTRAEAAELDQLESEYQRRFPGDPDTWDRAQLDDYLFTFANGSDGQCRRLRELRRRSGYFDQEED